MTFYAARVDYWLDRMPGTAKVRPELRRSSSCPRYLARVLRLKAFATRARARQWRAYHFAWEDWLPAKWVRVGRCETGGTAGATAAGNFAWDSGVYVSAFGIIRSGYADFAHAVGLRSWDETWIEKGRLPTPREQWRVADALQRRYGFGAWGCGGA